MRKQTGGDWRLVVKGEMNTTSNSCVAVAAFSRVDT